MLWSTVHLFLVPLFRKNDIRRSPDIILPQTLQIVLSALPHGSQPQTGYDLLNTSYRNITVLYYEILLNINHAGKWVILENL